MDDTELKPCFKCGKQAIYANAEGMASGGVKTNWATCSDEGCMPTPIVFSVDKWQSRPLEDALRANLARARTRIEQLGADLQHEINEKLTVAEADKAYINWLRDKISRLEAENRWIPVGERLPGNDRIVLVICASGYLTKGWNVQADYWWVFDDNKHEFHPRRHDDLVTHWRELPAPPEA